MPVGKRTRRASQAFQPTKISEDEFTSGDKFVFTIDSPSPKGRVTRSRRSSICLNPTTKPATKARRQTMLPAVKEKPKSPVKKSGTSNIVDQLLKTPSKAIGEFYDSPAKVKPSKMPGTHVSPTKAVSTSSSVSPTKKFSKSANKTLTEMEILENLDLDEEFDDKTPVNASKPPKTFETEIPAEKTKNRRKTVDIKSPIVVATAKADSKADKTSKIPVKSPATKSTKAKPAEEKTDPKADKMSRIPVKSPPMKSTKAKQTEEKAKKPVLVKAGKIKKSPVKKATKSAEIAKPDLKTPKKSGKVSLKDLPPGSPLLDSIFKDIKKVEIRLTPMKIKEDPNVIFDLLEEHQQSKFRVQKVVDEILKMKKEASPKTRLNAYKDDSVTEVTPVEKVEKVTKKVSTKTKAAPKSTKKADASPTLKPRGRKAPNVTDTAVDGKIVAKKTKKEEKNMKKEADVKMKESDESKLKTDSKVSKSVAKKGVKRALEAKSTPIQNKRIKLEKETPKAFEIREPAKKNTKTPRTEKKELKTPKPDIKVEPVTPATPEVTPITAKSTPKASVKKSASKKTPKLIVQYKQKTPLGSLKKPLKRLSVAKSTPAQVKPADLLKKNLRKQVETAITAKIGSKPDSSPYTITVSGGADASPVFTKVESVSSKVVKKHITGTPARSKPSRKFGTVIQPASLLEESVMPSSGEEHKAVSSSTPLKAAMTGAENSSEPHPLESVEATPIRAPGNLQPLSPQPMMVTGGLAKMCSIM